MLRFFRFLYNNNSVVRKYIKKEHNVNCYCTVDGVCRYHMNGIKADATLISFVLLLLIYLPAFFDTFWEGEIILTIGVKVALVYFVYFIIKMLIDL